MDEWNLPREGGCRCGRLRFRVSAPPAMTMACHCTGCQRMTGSAFSATAMVPADGFAVIAGEPVIGGLHGESRHFFCGHCLSWVFTRSPRLPGFVNVRSTLLDDTSGITPFVETWTTEKLPWAAASAARSFEGFPPPEAIPELLAAFAARGAQPAD